MTEFTITSHNPEGLVQQLRAIQSTGCGALTKECWAIANEIEAQIQPPVPAEPTEFGSIIRARRGERWNHFALTYSVPFNEPWTTGNHHVAYSEFDEVEVLRVGVGPSPEAVEAQTEPPVVQARDEYAEQMNLELRRSIAAQVLEAMDVDQYLIDAVRNATPPADAIPVEKVRQVLRSSPTGYLSDKEVLTAYKDLRKRIAALLPEGAQ